MITLTKRDSPTGCPFLMLLTLCVLCQRALVPGILCFVPPALCAEHRAAEALHFSALPPHTLLRLTFGVAEARQCMRFEARQTERETRLCQRILSAHHLAGEIKCPALRFLAREVVKKVC